jgi:hypothetical protein
MKAVAVALLFLPLSGLIAQNGGIGLEKAPPIVVPTLGALGGNYGGSGRSRPLGGIAPPTFPIGVPQQQNQQQSSGYRYIGPVYYVPNAYDSGFSAAPEYSTFNTPATPVTPAAPAAPPQPSVVINQYFNSRESLTPSTSAAAPVATGLPATATKADESAEPKYYLIAFKDRSVYTALAYWIEGDILHYVTTKNTHNQASVTLIDVDQTTKLNADNRLPFSLTPAK